jgi:hypothetical protein
VRSWLSSGAALLLTMPQWARVEFLVLLAAAHLGPLTGACSLAGAVVAAAGCAGTLSLSVSARRSRLLTVLAATAIILCVRCVCWNGRTGALLSIRGQCLRCCRSYPCSGQKYDRSSDQLSAGTC